MIENDKSIDELNSDLNNNLNSDLVSKVFERTKQNIYNELTEKLSEISSKKVNDEIESKIKEFNRYKKIYENKINIFVRAEVDLNYINTEKYNCINSESANSINNLVYNNINKFNEQVRIIDNQISRLYILKKEDDINKVLTELRNINEINQKIKDDFIDFSINEETELFEFIKNLSENSKVISYKDSNNNKAGIDSEQNDDIKKTNDNECLIENNPVLLISEIKNKVILPYTGREVEDILNSDDNDYTTEEEVIDKVFSRELSYYEDSARSRFREAFALATEKENYSKLDGIKLGMEMFNKRYLHPAIITACRSLDELDVYLDCLDKNELNDFKIFDIKYELHPVVVK